MRDIFLDCRTVRQAVASAMKFGTVGHNQTSVSKHLRVNKRMSRDKQQRTTDFDRDSRD
jgi:hypothetical protein